MNGDELYSDRYGKFLAEREKAAGYDFGHAPVGNVPPPTLKFRSPLRWWSLDRPRRIAALLRFRDRRLDEILALGIKPVPSIEPREGSRESNEPCGRLLMDDRRSRQISEKRRSPSTAERGSKAA